MQKYIFIFHNGTQEGIITKDCTLRLRAAYNLIKKERGNFIILLVGGGTLKEKGAEMMEKFWRKKYSCVNNVNTAKLAQSNNTAGNIHEINEYLKSKNINSEVIFISNNYHKWRIKYLARKYNLKIKFYGAEDILGIKNIYWNYKYLLELLFFLYLYIDNKQRIVEKWRKLTQG